jgi:hypothetical protein
MSVGCFLRVYFISIATILGTGILGLPVTLYSCGFFPFLIVFTLVLFAQVCVVFAFVELLQRTDASLVKLSNELRPISAIVPEQVESTSDSAVDSEVTERAENSSTLHDGIPVVAGS